MTDRELQDFIEHGETGFVEFAMMFGDGWAKHAIEIAKKLRARLAQPEREWQGLTDEERQECLYSDPIFGMAASTFARAIEAKLKEKNGAI